MVYLFLLVFMMLQTQSHASEKKLPPLPAINSDHLIIYNDFYKHRTDHYAHANNRAPELTQANLDAFTQDFEKLVMFTLFMAQAQEKNLGIDSCKQIADAVSLEHPKLTYLKTVLENQKSPNLVLSNS